MISRALVVAALCSSPRDNEPTHAPALARFSCASASGVGDHYFDGAEHDPWTTTYTSDFSGSATVNLTMPGFSMHDAMPVAYRTLVVHTTTSKAGCGLVHTESIVNDVASSPTGAPTPASAPSHASSPTKAPTPSDASTTSPTSPTSSSGSDDLSVSDDDDDHHLEQPVSSPTLEPTRTSSPTAVPTAAPTRAPVVKLSVGLSGIGCEAYGTPEERVVNLALMDELSDGSTIGDHTCTEISSRRLGGDEEEDPARQLSASITITMEITLPNNGDGDVLGGVTSGELATSIKSYADSEGVSTLASISVGSISVGTFAPTQAPTLGPTSADRTGRDDGSSNGGKKNDNDHCERFGETCFLIYFLVFVFSVVLIVLIVACICHNKKLEKAEKGELAIQVSTERV